MPFLLEKLDVYRRALDLADDLAGTARCDYPKDRVPKGTVFQESGSRPDRHASVGVCGVLARGAVISAESLPRRQHLT